MNTRGKFITFEGGEGSGKTTVIERLRDHLTEQGYEVLLTREPGGIGTAERIREVILDKEYTYMDGMTEVLLYVAARNEHLVHKVLPALEEGKIVLCDRFVDSSLVYQGHVRGIGMDRVKEVNNGVTKGIMPEFTFYLDVDPEVGLSRVMGNDEREKNRLDLEGLDFHQKVREGYLILKDNEPQRIKRVDANKELDEVIEQVLNVWEGRYE